MTETQRSMILIAPRFSEATQLSRQIALEMMEQFKAMGVRVLPIGHYRVRRIEFLRKLNQLHRLDEPPYLIVYAGHGEYSDVGSKGALVGGEFLGAKLTPLTLLNQKDYFLNRLIVNELTRYPTIFVAIGCKTEELGQYLVNKGLMTFVGTPENTYVTPLTQTDIPNAKPDIAYIYTTLVKAIIKGMLPSKAVKVASITSDIYKHHAEQIAQTEDDFKTIDEVYDSPLYYKVYGKDAKWTN